MRLLQLSTERQLRILGLNKKGGVVPRLFCFECSQCGNLSVFEQFLGFLDRCFAYFAVYSPRVINEFLEFFERSFCCFEGFLFASVFFVREILGEDGSCAAKAKAPSLECCGFVSETC